MQKSLLSIQLVGAGLALLFANACVVVSDDGNDTEVGDGDGDPGETGDGDGDQSEQGGDGDGDPGDGDGDPGDGDGDPGDGDGDGDGDPEPDPAITEACEAACAVFEGCEGSLPGCTEACVEQHLLYADDAECLGHELALTECMAGLTCDELIQFLDQEPVPFPCQAEFEAICENPGGECTVGVGMGENDGECSVTVTCDGLPDQSMECNGDTCTCYIEGTEVGGCSNAVEVCAEPGAGGLSECCG